MENSKKNILVAPLNWGLGHATRCIPIIRELEKNGFTPILASDGVALQLLQKEFPHLQSLELPSYEIEYAKNGADFKWKLIKNSPKMIEAIFAEKKLVKKWITEYDIQGIISDNRLGVYSKKIPSVFMTHQLNVLSGKTTWISSKLHQHFIKKFTECWIPDIKENPNLTGKLGHLKNSSLNLKYLGPLSRLEKKDLPIKYDLMVMLSGPEPQRTFLEEKLIKEIQSFDGKVLFIKGKIESVQKTTQDGNVTYYNFMTSSEIETAFNESETVLCRSGYTTVMDLAKLQKRAFFIPTPGQFEQEYLAKRLKRNGFIPYAKQDDFIIENLLEVTLYGGLPQLKKEIDWKQLLVLFERE
ncbi:UDP-N-acetylglucosamine--N-acetylmuramyl-(pentapeptide) pyrophosphoryl-undecaprenol N-acetylglucosamine transferase [Flavobacterium sangjuense]|uniref:UDP-N-acetylglucosamine--N-acetylmuramyl-(Pentapeptide) pyrophosphoryl-undecaprenol N-acetylglucosamine transferase n=1 Tax=Flavobacterium sangjuense TaxID=2518177 RepID=A0A4P7PRE6_9FLAO|nr:UDP-N-acetylglucosamine--N-acetylmuramyl-(pentapeptide) pyrophosphoryl-undecaprenol N-acetylglucosamine transferase [Flavobacterium sangjuense]QBZ97409.1 UDP-N-acetylglucosamine--N-acetylmuramyl-(pentapeptide) pyrophosphoryl-undecaprenol N-acetylglucosamine transferase [Flavobacterium sangjuense]